MFLFIREVATLLLFNLHYLFQMITIIITLFILSLDFYDKYIVLMMLSIKSGPGVKRCAQIYVCMYMRIYAMSLSTKNTCQNERRKF
jgi:hypothetical protein